MKENPYFKESEFYCKCGKCSMPQGTPPDELIDLLVQIREHYGKPITINSGYRCPTHNAKVGGATSSRHTKGDAADFVVKGVKTADVHKYCLEQWPNEHGIAIKHNFSNEYAGFVHLDVRGKKARWTYN